MTLVWLNKKAKLKYSKFVPFNLIQRFFFKKKSCFQSKINYLHYFQHYFQHCYFDCCCCCCCCCYCYCYCCYCCCCCCCCYCCCCLYDRRLPVQLLTRRQAKRCHDCANPCAWVGAWSERWLKAATATKTRPKAHCRSPFSDLAEVETLVANRSCQVEVFCGTKWRWSAMDNRDVRQTKQSATT